MILIGALILWYFQAPVEAYLFLSIFALGDPEL